MKLIIDIPEKIEEYIKDYIPIGAGNNVFCYPDEIVRMIQNGTPIPDNATNGDVIKAIFPKDPYSEEQTVYLGLEPIKHISYTPNSEPKNIHFQTMIINEDWWNAPYQKGGKNETN